LKWRRDGNIELTLPVQDLRDITPWLLSHGSAVQILAPRKLKESLKVELERMLAGL